MDGESFDRLSVVVHRLREQATRRSALRVLLGGSVLAATGLLGQETEAKKKHKNKKNTCRGFGGRCNSNRDCCFGKCRNGFCFNSGGGGGGNRCNGRRCPNGWKCCRQSGVDVCVPNNYPTCCGNNSYVDNFRCCGGGGACPIGWDCCGGFNQCCGSNQKCCGNGQCCPKGWYCGDIACYANQNARNAEITSESADSVPFSEPVTVDERDWIGLDQS